MEKIKKIFDLNGERLGPEALRKYKKYNIKNFKAIEQLFKKSL